MVGYFQCPAEAIKIFSISSETIGNVGGTLSLKEDKCWHLGIRFSLYEEPYNDLAPDEVVLLHLLIKREENHFIVKLASKNQEFKINRNESEALGSFYQSGELRPFYQYIYKQIKANFENQPQRFEEEKLLRKIGFKLD